MTVQYLVGDVFDRLEGLGDGSVDLVVTSPPFLTLRSYLPADHPEKDKEIGGEPTPGEFIETLLRVTGELRRVLAPHGSIAVELGDTNAGSGGAGGDYDEGGLRDGAPGYQGSERVQRAARKRSKPVSLSAVATEDASPPSRLRTRRLPGWPLAKSRCLIPESYRWALVYGVNPFTGDDSPAGTWIARNVVTWVKRNPVPGFLGDRWRYGTSDIVVATTSPTRYWDDLATRHENPRVDEFSRTRAQMNRGDPDYHTDGDDQNARQNPHGAPMLDWWKWDLPLDMTIGEAIEAGWFDGMDDWWEVTSKGFPGAHYAVYPPELVEPLIRAMCPERVCRTCGEPSERIIGREPHNLRPHLGEAGNVHPGNNGGSSTAGDTRFATTLSDLGWTDCGHVDWRPGIVLDPFAGSGTTLHVADALGRDAIGIDLDGRNEDLYESRLEEKGFLRLRQGSLL